MCHVVPFVLDKKLNLDEHIQFKIGECIKLIGIIKRLSATFHSLALLTIYKSFTIA